MTPPDTAWNNFVLHSEPTSYAHRSKKWAAALAKTFMNLANNGGINSFLTSTYEFAADDALEALSVIGATEAAMQLNKVLSDLGVPLAASSQNERWCLLEQYWSEELNGIDVLSDASSTQLMAILSAHVAEEAAFYLNL